MGNGGAAASPAKFFWAKLFRFGQIWGKIRQNLGKIEAIFGQK